jgi:putative membrane protein
MKKLGLLFSLLFTTLMCFADASTDNAQATNNAADQEIVATLITVNNNEINAADLATDKATNKKVKKYAKLMKKEHSKNLKEVMALSKKANITPQDTDAVNSLKQAGQQEAKDLDALTGKDFDKAYMDDMVKDHEAALSTLDNSLKQVSNPKLKKLLIDTKAHVAHHLEKAKEIQSKLDQGQAQAS